MSNIRNFSTTRKTSVYLLVLKKSPNIRQKIGILHLSIYTLCNYKFDRAIKSPPFSCINESEKLPIHFTNGLHAILNGTWGAITHLANEYGISRTFIYSLANNLKKIGQFLFEETTTTKCCRVCAV